LRILEQIGISLDNQEILQLLRSKNSSTQKGKASKEPSPQLLDDIESLKKEALELIETKAIYDVFSSKDLLPRHLFELSEKTIFAVCSISKALEDKISKQMDKGELAQGVILDAIASHAAEETASQLTKIILEENKEILHKNKYTSRFSPGYCRWSVEDGQKLIFSLLPVETIKVKLSPSFMMIPRKSVSFAINIGKRVEKDLGIKECVTCDLDDCDYRR